ncbi:hypothetical protein HDV05_005407 [Chytridiales sp. JEL 0842]|nr:hypothetical protein HDV05_005407 [Chytridiales sp. JEL 0842]
MRGSFAGSTLSAGMKKSALYDETHTALRLFLVEMQENPDIAPLLSTVLPCLTIEDNQFTKNMDGPSRCVLIKSLVLRIVSKLTKDEPTVICFDDCQWLDPMSCDIITALIKSCKNVFFVFMSRPQDELQNDAVNALFELPQRTHVTLNGLKVEDVEAMMIGRFKSMGVVTVEKSLVESIFKHTSGKPLNVDMILDSVLERWGRLMKVIEGHLSLIGPEQEDELLASASVGAITLAKFDRLSSTFQDLLRKATVLGYYFNLTDLAFMLDNDESAIKAIISEEDQDNFLIHDKEKSELSYSFRHGQILSAIYESLSYADRNNLHSMAGEYYEAALNDDTTDQLLPLISYHYSRTTDSKKRIEYLEQLSFTTYAKFHYRESMKSFEELLKFVDENPTAMQDSIRMANWRSHLAQFLAESKKYGDSAEQAILALQHIGRTWPKDPKSVKKALLKAALDMYVLWKNTNGGVKPFKTFRTMLLGQVLDPRTFNFADYYRLDYQQDNHQNFQAVTKAKKPKANPENEYNSPRYRDVLLKSYLALFRSGLYAGAIERPAMILALVQNGNTLIKIGHYDPCEWCMICYYIGFGTSWVNHKISAAFFKKAIWLDTQFDLSPKVYIQYHVAGLQYFYIRGEVEKAKPYVEKFVTYNQERGNYFNELAGTSMYLGLQFYSGDITTDKDNAEKRASAEALENIWNCPVIYSVWRRHACRDEPDHRQESERLYHRVEALWPYLPQRPIYRSLIELPRCWRAIGRNEAQEALKQYALLSESFSSLDQNNTPIMEILCQAPMLTWFLLSNMSLHLLETLGAKAAETPSWTKQELDTLLQATQAYQKVLSVFGVKHKMVICLWPYKMFAAASGLLSTKRSKALEDLKRFVETPKNAAIVEEVKMMSAFTFFILGHHLEGKEERENYLAKSRKLFVSFGASWLSTSDQWIALDRIQNVTIEKPFMCGLAKVANLSIQTAGTTGASESGSDGTARLMGCKDAAKVRDIIIAKRDALAQRACAPPGGGSGGDENFITKQPGAGPSMYDAIVSLTNSINKLESTMTKSSS